MEKRYGFTTPDGVQHEIEGGPIEAKFLQGDIHSKGSDLHDSIAMAIDQIRKSRPGEEVDVILETKVHDEIVFLTKEVDNIKVKYGIDFGAKSGSSASLVSFKDGAPVVRRIYKLDLGMCKTPWSLNKEQLKRLDFIISRLK